MATTLTPADRADRGVAMIAAVAEMHATYGFARVWWHGQSTRLARIEAEDWVWQEIAACRDWDDMRGLHVGPSIGDDD